MLVQKSVSQYIRERDGAWRLWFRSDLWNQKLWGELRDRLAAERPGRHPRTVEIRLAGAAQPLFLKAFYGASALGSFKDFFRRSKAVRSIVLTESFAGLGFNAPIAIGAGEERYANLLRRSFVVTLPVSVAVSPQRGGQARKADVTETPLADLTGIRVLVVDDVLFHPPQA